MSTQITAYNVVRQPEWTYNDVMSEVIRVTWLLLEAAPYRVVIDVIDSGEVYHVRTEYRH